MSVDNADTASNGCVKVAREISWPKVLFNIHVNILGIYALGHILDASLLTILFSTLLVFLGVIGVTAGAHRLWAHRSYEASTALRVFLMLCHTLAGQGSIHDWVVWHRVHHQHHGTDHDCYNHHRGFWHSHIIANVIKTSKTDLQLYKQIDAQDLENDGVVAFQKKFYWLLMPIICILLPVNAPMEYWGDSVLASLFVAGFLRYAIISHMTWLIHSSIHIWGLKPNDKYPADTMLVFILTKSHWPQYHYILPWDYQVGEYGGYGDGYISSIIRVFNAFGWATCLRTVSTDTVKEAVYRATTTGKSVDECVQEITATTKTRSTAQGHFHSAKFL